jgi:hypothetical protein
MSQLPAASVSSAEQSSSHSMQRVAAQISCCRALDMALLVASQAVERMKEQQQQQQQQQQAVSSAAA